ncbi:hypothetical protein KUTeg_017013, partial [Tegillarca granosa]
MAAQVALRRHQASEMTGPIKAKVKNATQVLNQRKLLQRNIRAIRQPPGNKHAGTDLKIKYPKRLTASQMNVPVPIINERMRKRRCFADKDLDAAMYEQERQMEYITSVNKQETIKQDMTKHLSLLESRGIPKEMSSQRALLQHLFPNYNQNVLELIWQGSEGNMERTIQ